MGLNLDTFSGASLETSDGIARTIVGLVLVFAIGLMVLNGIDHSSGSSQVSSIVFTWTENPTDGEFVRIDNSIFEFDIGDGVEANHIPVTIGATVADTIHNFNTAVHTAGYVI